MFWHMCEIVNCCLDFDAHIDTCSRRNVSPAVLVGHLLRTMPFYWSFSGSSTRSWTRNGMAFSETNDPLRYPWALAVKLLMLTRQLYCQSPSFFTPCWRRYCDWVRPKGIERWRKLGATLWVYTLAQRLPD